MPDISLLQHEYYAPEEEKSRIPGIASIGGFIALIAVGAVYAGLFLYQRVLASRAEDLAKNIAEVKVEEITQTVRDMKIFGAQAKALVALRGAHAYPVKLFEYLERTTHPAVYFSDANISMKEKTITMKGTTGSPLFLARQVQVYEKEKKEGRIADFIVTGVGYGEKKKVSFNLTLTFVK